MSDLFISICRAFVAGTVATLVMDLILIARRRWAGIPMLDYAVVGRLVTDLIVSQNTSFPTAPADYDRRDMIVGWTAHYLIGIGFAALLIIGVGPQPTFLECLLFGMMTSAAPFLVMQPAMGLGPFAARAPEPGKARINTLFTHLCFGAGLFVGAELSGALF